MISVVVLIFFGIFLWLTNLKILNWTRDWSLILIFFGIIILFNLIRRSKKANIIRDLERGKITVQEAEERLKK